MRGRYVFGGRFERHLNIVTERRHVKGVTERREQRRDGIRRKQRRRAATQVERFETVLRRTPGRRPGVSRADHLQFPEYRFHILPGWDALPDRDREIAIGAAAHAEGDVEVEVGHEQKLIA